MAAAISRVVRGAPRSALAAARAGAVDGAARPAWRGLAACAPRFSLALGRRRADGTGLRARSGDTAAWRRVDHHLRRRPGPRRVGAHLEPRAALRRRTR